MRIVHITNLHLFLGGGERLIYSWLQNSRHESLCYSASGGMQYGKDERMLTYDSEAEFNALVERHRNDLIVLHDVMVVDSPALAGLRCVQFCHGAFTFGRDISAWPVHLALSNYPPPIRHQSWNRIPLVDVCLGVDPVQFQPPKSVKRGPRIRAAIVGRVSEEKIPLYFFDFIAKFNREHGGVDFRFYGKGMPGSYLDEFTQRIRSTANCYHMGALGIDKVQKAYHDNDVLIVPSLSETGSFAIVEAQMCGLRVLALANDGIPYHLNGASVGCVNYDHIFSVLAGLGRDSIGDRRKQHAITVSRHDIKSWAKKLDAVAEMAYELR